MAHQRPSQSPVIARWLQDLSTNSFTNRRDHPNYYANRPEDLQSSATLHSFMVGSGAQIFSQLQSSIEAVESELVLVTCFWAGSPSLETLVRSLRSLSDKVIRNKRPKIRVFIGFSSLSLWQKLFHTWSLAGRTYAPSEWPKRLGLPHEWELPGLEITVKSIFLLPFSVMHPKFVILDRKVVCVPSCNVSWETWFEGAAVMSGDIVGQFVRFWREFWLSSSTSFPALDNDSSTSTTSTYTQHLSSPADSHGAFHKHNPLPSSPPRQAYFLPSPHHINPRFSLLPWATPHPPPPTPLNLFLLTHLRAAHHTIFMQSPNVTCPAVLSALRDALARGVHVHVVTSARLMRLEQLVTAGTTTGRCVRALVRDYARLRGRAPALRDGERDVERGERPVGGLRVDFWRPGSAAEEPVQSHLKLTVVDERVVVLGSGNMDRASWFTSQEVGVGVESREVAGEVRRIVREAGKGRTSCFFES